MTSQEIEYKHHTCGDRTEFKKQTEQCLKSPINLVAEEQFSLCKRNMLK